MPFLLAARQNPLDSAKATLSSWDSCMAKVYCKWPVIVGIVVGSLILISVITCIARCICCGAECACCCFRCCTSCCGGGGGRKSGHKRMNSEPKASYPPPFATPIANSYAAAAPPAPPVDARPLNEQYRSNARPTFAPAPVPDRPQYATFSSPNKPVNEDALPSMPTWNDGRDMHVQVEEPVPVPEKRGDMELDRLTSNGSTTNVSSNGMSAVGGARRSPGPGGPRRSPGPGAARSPAHDPYSYGNDPFANPQPQRNGPSPGPYTRPYVQQDDYRRASPGPMRSPTYQTPGDGYAQNAPYGRNSPAPRSPQHDPYYNNNPSMNPNINSNYTIASNPTDNYPPTQRFHSPSPPNNNNTYPYPTQPSRSPAPQGPLPPSSQSYNDFSPASHRANTPQYDNSASSTLPSSLRPANSPTTTAMPAYPGQQMYNSSDAAGAGYPGQKTYRAFSPAA